MIISYLKTLVNGVHTLGKQTFCLLLGGFLSFLAKPSSSDKHLLSTHQVPGPNNLSLGSPPSLTRSEYTAC